MHNFKDNFRDATILCHVEGKVMQSELDWSASLSTHACAFQAIRKINKLTPWINRSACSTPSDINFEAELYLHCYLYCKISKGY